MESVGRSVDIELGGQEVITIDLDNLDPNPEDVLDLLKEGQCKVWVWTKLAGEYWRRGYLGPAEKIAQQAVESFKSNNATSSLAPIYALLANIQVAHARSAPKLILPGARQDILKGEKTKEEYYRESAQFINNFQMVAEGSEGAATAMAFLTRGIQQLATRSMDDALASFENVLLTMPTNLLALLGKARILYARRQYSQALRIFQQVLTYNPNCNPDPRIGIGLCLWAMNHKEKAKAAWQRSVEINPSEWSAQLLLGLEAINASKGDNLSDQEIAHSYLTGTKLIEKAFKANQKSSAATNALCELFLRKGNYQRALKLAERTIQYADTTTVLTEGYQRAARVSHIEGLIPESIRYYTAATAAQPKHILSAIGLAQAQLQNDETAAAIHTLDTLLQPPNAQRSLEATVMLASLRAHPRPGISNLDAAQERLKARELFDRVTKTLEAEDSRANGHVNGHPPGVGPSKSTRRLAEDRDMYIEIARLWQDDSLDRMGRALREALQISEASGVVDSRLLNNLGALNHFEGHLPEAREMYERALTSAAAVGSVIGEGMSTSILYNLARVYEDGGEETMAKEAYDKLLARHPEYVDAKIRQAQILADVNRHNEAHELVKQALTSQNNNLNLRAFYTYFLIQSNLSKPAKDFVFATLKDHDKHDVYSLCAAGWIQYHQSRESRDASQKASEERRRGFRRSAEFYEKALQLDPLCAVAAQGLAIVTAEDALGTLSGGAASSDEAQKRLQNARDALDVFAKVRESVSDGSVYANMGHCYYARDEYDRAIESYETASTRFYGGHNVPVLLCLCRSWYAKASKDQSFTAMNTSLKYAQLALHLQPSDKAVVYNIAMIEQKAAEMLFAVSPSKRSLTDMERAINQAGHAQKLFASLASDKSPLVPYSRDIADQRRKYGESMLRKADEHLATQRQYESEAQAKLSAARQKRQEDRDRQEAIERERMEELKQQAEKLAEERRIARGQALEWTAGFKEDSDEEKEKRVRRAAKKEKSKAEAGSGDEGVEPKKKRRLKAKKEELEDHEDQALFSDQEEGEKTSKKRGTKKRVIREDDEEEAAGAPRKKQFKSKEMLSDTDDDDDML